MYTRYSKPHLSYEQQVKLLKSRNLRIDDDAYALERLRRFGYYRLSAYWYIFRTLRPPQPDANLSLREDVFQPGYSFQHVVDLYVFDKKLRLLMLDALERIEITVRIDVAYTLGGQDPFAHDNPRFLHPQASRIKAGERMSRFDKWKVAHDRTLARSKEEFVKHFKIRYGTPLPIWADVETWDFGLLSHFFSMLNVRDKQTIAKRFDIQDWRVMESWLRSMNHVRNIAAQHSRLWNRNLVDQPRMPARTTMPGFDHLIGDRSAISRVYSAICIVSHFMLCISPESEWFKRLDDHIHSFPGIPNVSHSNMGFPPGWEQLGIWTQAAK